MDEYIMVRVNGIYYPTEIIDNVQRFVPNKLIKLLVDTRQIDLNRLCFDFQETNLFSVAEYIDFYCKTGISVCGLQDAFGDEEIYGEMEIINPLWKEGNE